ncbi:cadmium resistance protein CadD (predicted permease) [Shimia isoporae]|uniref:Cadmium resistance protein CadD (Predicted permease) n=1 Tax=Shimia isoporae TaxID=647720 RepID=A0A4R1NRB1_9RHOB|nr:hypothetical protein [Shimia isoporae]TCL09273.1 cadmium resistance protein CadD (predicted permease) [Shimia isoporae]
MDILGFGFSAFVAHLLTNIDNLAIMAGMILTLGIWRTTVGYLAAQVIMLGAAMLLAEGLESEVPNAVGYLGLVPLLLGFTALARQWRGGEDAKHSFDRMRVIAVIALFLSVSLDSFAVFAPLLADSTDSYRAAALGGAAVSALLLAIVGLAVTRATGGLITRVVRLDRFAPYVMIAVGFYVLMNTATDMV